MTVGLKLGSVTDEVGGQDFFHAFFSTISYRLERSGWGSRFPCLLKKLYQGKLEQNDAKQALEELAIITLELSRLSPDQVVWDIEDLKSSPPWGNDISDDITSLSNYFVTSSGRDLLGVLRECLEELRDRGGSLEIVSI
ncbi:immunity 70 family protein [Gallaecimonas kandeliae]|uniref:immunity 70 family protein n=1 Tax=Gallaecimonas kandeliae TaxID=3029055 RepID=UPI00264844FF|nr:immunity 70 family protein [Gallaecimonas kandeliae]WKE65264.1 immunity 70 family protein [Gallaecimonas kandeliae]